MSDTLNIFGVDIETSSNDSSNPQYALEAFRLIQGKARITNISITGHQYQKLIKEPSKGQVLELCEFLSGKVAYFHFATFDISWFYAILRDVEPLKKIYIRDSMLLAKWILNGQATQFATKDEDNRGYTLKALVGRFLSDHPGVEEFLRMKDEEVIAGENQEYWDKRAMMDSYYTRELAIHMQNILPHIQRNGFMISQKSIPYVCRSYVEGAPFNLDEVKRIIPKIVEAKQAYANKLGIHQSVIQSPSQLSQLIFDEWGLTPINRGKPKKGYPQGQGSTAAGDLKMLALQAQGTDIGEKMKMIMQFNQLKTLESKYVNGFIRVNDYVGEPVCHGVPNMFGTYTGRYTYASKTQRKQDWQTSIAMHQLPRKGPAKSWILPPYGYDVGKYDASGQEIAFMAWASGDLNMLAVLNNGLNIHSWMATNINGMDYYDFIKILKTDKNAYEERQAAKLTNLSCQYRIGWKALQGKFFDTYDKIISRQESNRYLTIYKTAYPGVPIYWKNICIESMEKGYAETIARRRYQLTDWDTHRWGTESSAINTPVQGSGADQKDLVIWLVSENFPEIRFALDVHDEGIFYLPSKYSEELNKEIVHFLNCIDYESFWQREVPMPLTFEGQLGKNFKDCEEYAQPWDDIVNMRKDKGLKR